MSVGKFVFCFVSASREYNHKTQPHKLGDFHFALICGTHCADSKRAQRPLKTTRRAFCSLKTDYSGERHIAPTRNELSLNQTNKQTHVRAVRARCSARNPQRDATYMLDACVFGRSRADGYRASLDEINMYTFSTWMNALCTGEL